MNAKHTLALPAAAVAALLLAGCANDGGTDDDLYGQDPAVGTDNRGPRTDTDSMMDMQTPSRRTVEGVDADGRRPRTDTDSMMDMQTPSRRGGVVVDNNVEADPDGTIKTPGVNPEASPRDGVPSGGRAGEPEAGELRITSEPVRTSTGSTGRGTAPRTTRTPEMTDDAIGTDDPMMNQNKDGMTGGAAGTPRVRDVEVDDAAVGLERPTMNKDEMGAEVVLEEPGDRPATRPAFSPDNK